MPTKSNGETQTTVIRWSLLPLGTLFIYNTRVFMKVRDTGYFFGIANSMDYWGEWSLIPTDSEVQTTDKWEGGK